MRLTELLCVAVMTGSLLGCGGDDAKSSGPTKPIYLRGLQDRSGPTAALGQVIGRAWNDLIREVNETEAIPGHHIEIVGELADHGYSGANAVTIWAGDIGDPNDPLDDIKGWRDDPTWADVSAVLGWGSPDAVALNSYATEDQMPMVTGAYPGSLASPLPVQKTVSVPQPNGPATDVIITNPGAPYVFFAGTDYSTAVRAGLQFISEAGGGNIAFQGCTSAACIDPLNAGKTYAAGIGGLTVVEDYPVEFAWANDDPTNAFWQQESADYFVAHPNVDWIWISSLAGWTAKIANFVAEQSPNTKLLVNIWGFDETLLTPCGDACIDRVYGMAPFAMYGDTRYPGMETVVALNEKYRNDIDQEPISITSNAFYVRGYMMLWKLVKAAQMVVAAGDEPNKFTMHAALESMTDVSTGGLTTPLSFSPTDHRPTMGSHIYSINVFGKFRYETEITLPRNPDWLGW